MDHRSTFGVNCKHHVNIAYIGSLFLYIYIYIYIYIYRNTIFYVIIYPHEEPAAQLVTVQINATD